MEQVLSRQIELMEKQPIKITSEKMDKYSWFQSIKWMEKSNYNTFWHSAEPWLSLSISWDENNKLECESFCSIFTYVWALSCNFCLIYNSQDDNNTRRTWIVSGCFKSLLWMTVMSAVEQMEQIRSWILTRGH